MKTSTYVMIGNLARVWNARHPDLAARILRAVEIVKAGDVLPCLADRSDGSATYLVRGNSLYRVRIPPHKKGKVTCTCPDFGRVSHCKHMLAVALLKKVDALPKEPVVSYGLDNSPSSEYVLCLRTSFPCGWFPLKKS